MIKNQPVNSGFAVFLLINSNMRFYYGNPLKKAPANSLNTQNVYVKLAGCSFNPNSIYINCVF